MKTLAATLVLLTSAASVGHAQTIDLSPDVRLEHVDQGHHRKVKGQVLVGIAVVNLAIGLALGTTVAVEDRHGGGGLVSAAIETGAILATLAGVGCAAGGIPLWAMGAKEEQHAKVSLSASAGGLKLTF